MYLCRKQFINNLRPVERQTFMKQSVSNLIVSRWDIHTAWDDMAHASPFTVRPTSISDYFLTLILSRASNQTKRNEISVSQDPCHSNHPNESSRFRFLHYFYLFIFFFSFLFIRLSTHLSVSIAIKWINFRPKLCNRYGEISDEEKRKKKIN